MGENLSKIMNKPAKNYKTRQIGLKYTDKIDLTYKVLRLYSVLIEPLTKNNIKLLAICFLYDINSDEFKDVVINSNIGITNDMQLRVEMHRLKKQGFIEKDKVANRKNLSQKLQQFAKLVNENSEIGLFVTFDMLTNT